MAATSVFLCMCLIALCQLISVTCVEIRGLHPDKKQFYDPGKDFTCLDGSHTVPFSLVNDDYCDCLDGSDEPGTAACDRATFYCPNKDHQPQNVLSSRVNDGICDCCDGSDEWDSDATCSNTCVEFGRKAAEDFRQRIELQEEGYKKRQSYAEDGRLKIEEKRVSLSEKEAQLDLVKAEFENLKELKEAAESPEKEAKEEHRLKWEETKAARKEARRVAEARAGFDELDTDSDGYVSLAEIQARSELDDDSDGEVSMEEALEYLDNKQSIDFDAFLETLWEIVSDKISFTPLLAPETEPPGDALPSDEDFDPEDYEDGEDYDYDDNDLPPVVDDEDKMPDYDEATQELVSAADNARATYREIEQKKRNLDNEVADLTKFFAVNLGTDNEFVPHYDKCYELTDREYTYKLCMFGKVTQKSKNGGRDTNLGTWGAWNGPPNNQYSSMRYENGEKCWNGPSRSTIVSITCGVEDAVIAASEPNRCEYAMEFTTPVVCEPHQQTYHQEL